MTPGALVRGRLRNAAQSLLLIALMCLILASVGFLVAGNSGLIIALTAALVIILMGPKASTGFILRMHGARRLSPSETPGLHSLTGELARRAGARTTPELYYIPSRMMNAFSVGTGDRTAIALTDGIIRNLNWRELTAVLAHEVSHISSGDLAIMGLADALSRFIHALSTIGIFMLIIYLPVIIIAGLKIPIPAILILIFGPSASILLQMALSRTREYDADLNAVRLTGDPEGLASALRKIEIYRMKIWDFLFMPGRKVPHPSLLRSHPYTEKRIARLAEISARNGSFPYPRREAGEPADRFQAIEQKPKWRIGGIWR